MRRSAFDGVKIADFSWILAGPTVSTYLAAHGATVVRVESRTELDNTRIDAPHKDGVPGVNRSGFFGYINPNKYSLTLNLNSSGGMEVARKLIAWSDVVNENFSPGRMEKWGLGYEDLKKIRPDIIMVRSSIQGQTGPWTRRRGFGILAAGQAGFSEITGWPDGEPCTSYIGYCDFIAPRFCIAALAAALAHRKRTGEGVCIDTGQIEPGLYFLAPAVLDYTVNGTLLKRQGNYSPCSAPHGVYRCQGDDRWCAISVSSDDEWKAFCGVLGNQKWTEEPRFATFLERKHNEDELNRLVEAWTSVHTAEDVMRMMQDKDVAAGVVKNMRDLVEDPQLNERNHIWWLKHPEMGHFPHMGSTVVMSKTPAEPRMPAPCLGEHTEYVCRKLLGMRKAEFKSYNEAGAFE